MIRSSLVKLVAAGALALACAPAMGKPVAPVSKVNEVKKVEPKKKAPTTRPTASTPRPASVRLGKQDTKITPIKTSTPSKKVAAKPQPAKMKVGTDKAAMEKSKQPLSIRSTPAKLPVPKSTLDRTAENRKMPAKGDEMKPSGK